MHTPPNDENLLIDASFDRAARRGVLLLFAVIIVYLGLVFSLPRSLQAVVGLGGMFALCLGVLGFVLWLAPQSPAMKQMRPAARRYVMRFLPAMMTYVLVFSVATWVYKARHPMSVEAVLLALAPSLPILAAIRAMMLFLKEETDEYLRSRMLESWALATGLALAACTVWGFLDQFEVVPHLPLWAVFPVWALCLLPAQMLLKRRGA